MNMNPHTNLNHAGASSSVEDAEIESTTVTRHPGPAHRVTPTSAVAGERLSARRRELAGKEPKPLTVKIVKPSVFPEEKPLVKKNQPSFANNASLVLDRRDSSGILSTAQQDNSLQESPISPYRNSLPQETPGSDAVAADGSVPTLSRHRTGHRHWGKVQEHIHEEEERKKRAVDKWASVTAGIKSNVANWFGVGDEDEEARQQTLNRWRSHVERMHANSSLLGGYKRRAETLDSVFEHSSAQPSPAVVPKTPQPYDPLARGHRTPASRQMSRISVASSSKRYGRPLPTKRAERDHVWKMALDGVKGLMMPGKVAKKPSLHSRSIMLNQIRGEVPTPSPTVNSVFQSEESSYLDDVFFDNATPTSAAVPPLASRLEPATSVDQSSTVVPQIADTYHVVPPLARHGPSKAGWQARRSRPEPAPGDTPATDVENPFKGMKRIADQMVTDVLENPDKRQLGKGFAGFLTDAEYRKSRLDSDIRLQMADMDDHRPFFTYWVTFVQVVCYIIAVSVYQLSTIGFSETKIESQALMPSLAIEYVSYMEEDNMWIGPRQADLIHLGAKYSPCMRKDANIEYALAVDRQLESRTACCIRDDGSGCVQSLENDCSPTLSDFVTWNTTVGGPSGRKSGAVCGQDPRFCNNPKSMQPYQWADDISKWPYCKEPIIPSKTNDTRHMTCSILGRPCCTGIQGQCLITTREHCTFLRGYFYQNRTLCSQISCMNEICGMSPFSDPEIPDQFYRLFTSLFLHAGLLQLIITVLFQAFVMRDMEKLAGSVRIAIIYIASGIAGSLSSAIFLPYHVEAGPSGSQFGLLACLFVEIIQNWYILTNPGMALAKLGFLLLTLFIVGLLPMVDNYAHLIGFVFGFLLSFALLPYITFNLKDKRGKLTGIVVCLVATIGLFIVLVILFYVSPVYSCPHCHYFNCIPFTPNFCKSMEVQIRR